MQTLFDRSTATEIKARLARMRADSPRQWGKMTPPQAVAHLAKGMEMAVGELNPPRELMGYLFGGIVKPLALGDEKPFKRNSPTAKSLLVADERDLERERERLVALIDRFVEGGPAKCSTHPHAFFGRMTPEEWGVLSYKHLDHHLRQFGV